MTNKVFIIAEAGVNHNGSVETALEMIDTAKNCGANAIKFQTFSAEELVTKDATMADYQKKNIGRSFSQFEMLKALEISHKDHFKLKEYCDTKGIIFMSSPFSDKDAEFLISDLKIDTIKIGSGEITNLRMLNTIGKSGSKIILSTGMSSMEEVETGLGAIGLGTSSPETPPSLQNSKNWALNNSIGSKLKGKVTVLHCTSNYPAADEELNLSAIATMNHHLDLNIGYSDHSSGVWAALTAFGYGARCFEKHFTLDVNQEGPDHAASIEPEELKTYISNLRRAENAAGDGEKQAQPSELKTLTIARKSVVAKNQIKAGDLLTEENITLKRPGSGISSEYFYDVLGTKAKTGYNTNQLIEGSQLEK